MSKLSVVLATYNEAQNLAECLDSVKELASEIIIVDGSSSDSTVDIAKRYGASVKIVPNQTNFHINKQIAIGMAKSPWVLLLDADERISAHLRDEIAKVIKMSADEIADYQSKIQNKRLFLRHQKILEKRDGRVGTTDGDYVAFFLPRLNYFLGGYLRYGGVYPDGVIRLFRNGFAYLPAKDVHEQMVVNGKVGWINADLMHKDSPTFARYLQRNSRYIDLMVRDFHNQHLPKNMLQLLKYGFILPMVWFISTLVRNKGLLDGWRGFIFSFFSALRFPRAYIRYLQNA